MVYTVVGVVLIVFVVIKSALVLEKAYVSQLCVNVTNQNASNFSKDASARLFASLHPVFAFKMTIKYASRGFVAALLASKLDHKIP